MFGRKLFTPATSALTSFDMVNGEVVAYNIASLLCALFVLERGADVFIDHTAIVAQRTGIPQSAIALLTAGAEWEEVSVFCAAIPPF